MGVAGMYGRVEAIVRAIAESILWEMAVISLLEEGRVRSPPGAAGGSASAFSNFPV